MKSVPLSLVSSVTLLLPFTSCVLHGSLQLFAIGAVVVHELSKDIIERTFGEARVPNLVLNSLVQLFFEEHERWQPFSFNGVGEVRGCLFRQCQ